MDPLLSPERIVYTPGEVDSQVAGTKEDALGTTVGGACRRGRNDGGVGGERAQQTTAPSAAPQRETHPLQCHSQTLI